MTKRIALFVALIVLFVVASTLANATPPSAPATPAPKALPLPPGAGLVDPAPFMALAGPDGPVTEIYLKGPLLKAMSSGFAKKDPDTGKMVGGLEAVTTIVVELKASQLEQARQLVSATSKRLLAQGWEVLARVKDKDSNITVLTRSNDAKGLFQGLQVFVLDGEGESKDKDTRYDLVFANIAGPISFSDIAKIGEQFEIPGIEDAVDAIPGAEK